MILRTIEDTKTALNVETIDFEVALYRVVTGSFWVK